MQTTDTKRNPRPSNHEDFLPLIGNSKTKVKYSVTLVEEVLISKLKIGDRTAFSYFFSAYYKDLVMFASRFTKDLNNAEEIVQDVFVILWEEHESIKINISIKSYLLKLVQNRCIDWYRHKKIIKIHNNSVMQNSPHFDYITDNYILYSELQGQIEKVLEMLPKTVSDSFRMNRYEGLKYHEIATILNVSIRTIEVRIGKALFILRKYLKDYFITIISLLCLLV